MKYFGLIMMLISAMGLHQLEERVYENPFIGHWELHPSEGCTEYYQITKNHFFINSHEELEKRDFQIISKTNNIFIVVSKKLANNLKPDCEGHVDSMAEESIYHLYFKLAADSDSFHIYFNYPGESVVGKVERIENKLDIFNEFRALHQ